MVNGISTIPLYGRDSTARAVRGAAVQGFSEFLAGPENCLAVTAFEPFLRRAATPFSPLVLYGPHASGKSHLARGLAAWCRKHDPAARIECMAASEFAQAYSAALENRQLESWRHSIRELALLILDDLGQLAGKRGAQQELLQSLDALAQREALVVVTAHAIPSNCAELMAALRSRLSQGLTVPLALPGNLARRTLLEKYTDARKSPLSKRALHRLADALPVSVPALVSALLELELLARTDGIPIDARRIRQFAAARTLARMSSLRDIACATAKYFGLKLSELQSPLRRQPLVAARGVAMYLSRLLTNKSLHQIGGYWGGRDHTTVLHACRRTERLLKTDRTTRAAVAELKKALTAP